MNKENNKNKLISKNRFLLTQFFRKYSYWIWPLIIGIAFLIAIVLCKVFKVNLDHLSDLTPTFIGGLFTLIGFALTIFAIIGTIDKNFYKGHLDALCKNIVFCIIFATLGILSALIPDSTLFIIGFTLLSLTNFFILLRYVYYSVKYQIHKNN